MAQKRKDFIPLNIKLDKPVAEELEKFTEKDRIIQNGNRRKRSKDLYRAIQQNR